MSVEDSDSQARLQIEMAAAGCVSGTLAEWPHLKAALRRWGVQLPDSTTARELKRECLKLTQHLS